MSGKKIALISSESLPNWVSSRTIRSNLLQSYLVAFPKAQQIVYQNTKKGLDELAVRLINGKFDKIVFLESIPCPLEILSKLNQKKNLIQSLEWHFHIYGDLTLFTPEWLSIFKILKRVPVKIFLASDAQVGLVSEFFQKNSLANIEICPFPINSKDFRLIEHRPQIRKKNRFAVDEIVLVYAGRVSDHKGIPLAIRWLHRFSVETGFDRFRFLIAGDFDDLGGLFWHHQPPLGSSYFSFQEAVRELPKKLQKKIQFLGPQSRPELREIYGIADVFLSLSTYHDEDYGMAPLEALFCGCPALLSSWGGFASFRLNDQDVRLCQVNIRKKGLTMSYADFRRGLQALIDQALRRDESARILRAERYQQKFSIEAVALLLREQSQQAAQPLKSVSSVLALHATKLMGLRQGSALFTSQSTQDFLYHRLYRHYVSSEK